MNSLSVGRQFKSVWAHHIQPRKPLVYGVFCCLKISDHRIFIDRMWSICSIIRWAKLKYQKIHRPFSFHYILTFDVSIVIDE